MVNPIATTATVVAIVPSMTSAETVGKDPNCNDRTCLGVWDGLLADCPHGRSVGAGCVSSQDDTPGVFAEPWDYSEDAFVADSSFVTVLNKVQSAILSVAGRRGDTVHIILRQGRYLRVSILDAQSTEASTGEFYITPNDTTVQFRIAASSGLPGGRSSLRNVERAESIRKELRFLKLPVLRNRQRSFLFVESDALDRFGPGSASLGPPAELGRDALEGRADFDPLLKVDLLQQFPLRKLNK